MFASIQIGVLASPKRHAQLCDGLPPTSKTPTRPQNISKRSCRHPRLSVARLLLSRCTFVDCAPSTPHLRAKARRARARVWGDSQPAGSRWALDGCCGEADPNELRVAGCRGAMAMDRTQLPLSWMREALVPSLLSCAVDRRRGPLRQRALLTDPLARPTIYSLRHA